MNGSICENIAELHALRAFGKDEEALVRHLDDLMDGRQGAVGVQIAGLRRVHARIALGDDDDGLLVAERLDQLDGTFAAHSQRQHGMGKQNGIANGKHRQRLASAVFVAPFWWSLG